MSAISESWTVSGPICNKLTVVTEVVHQDDLPDEMLRAPVEDADDGPEQGRPGLVVECDDH